MSSPERIATRIVTLRGQRVILDADLASLYGVETRVMLQAVRRNFERFPPDFMFELSNQDVAVFEITIRDLKAHGARGPPIRALRVH